MDAADSNQPVSGRGTWLESLREELSRQLAAPAASVAGTKSIIAWYMQRGYAMGVPRADLEIMLAGEPQLAEIARSLSDGEIGQGKPAPDFNDGDAVEVIVNAKNTTYHKGHVRLVQWHTNERKWLYLLADEQGRNVSKRYSADDLRTVAD
jgi:hypothetical protein